jgi:hypothetical protein
VATNKFPPEELERRRQVKEQRSQERLAGLLQRDALECIISLAEAEKVSGLSEDTWRRRHSAKFVRLSPRRIGVRLRDALSPEA